MKISKSDNLIKSTYLSIKPPPVAARIMHITEVVGADMGKPAELKCEAIGNPAPIVTWRRKNRGGRVAGSGRHITTVSVKSVYKIDRVEERNFGWYVCTASVANFPPASAEAMLLKNGKEPGVCMRVYVCVYFFLF